ncbi:unnamed protein product, partial [Heterosigma akashiwo]
RRWLIISLVCSLNFVAQAVSMTFASTILQAAKHFDVAQTDVVFLTNVYPVLFFPSLILATYHLQTKGTRYALVAGSLITSIGCLIRLSSQIFPPNPSYGLLLLGQSVCAMAQSVCLLSPMRVATDWFSSRENSLALNFAVYSGILGEATGLMLPYEFEESDGSLDFTRMLLLQAALITAICLLVYRFYAEDQPYTTLLNDESERSQTEGLGRNKQDVFYLTAGFSLVYGALQAFEACLSQYMWEAASIRGDFPAVVGVCSILFGFVVSSVVGMVTDSLPHAKNAVVKVLAVASAAGAFALALGRTGVDQAPLVTLVCLPFGFAYGLVPAALDLGTEYTYPLAEEISAGLLYSAGGLCAFVSSLLLTHLLAGQNALWQGRLHPGAIYLLVQLVLGAGFIVTLHGRCRRSEAERRRARR